MHWKSTLRLAALNLRKKEEDNRRGGRARAARGFGKYRQSIFIWGIALAACAVLMAVAIYAVAIYALAIYAVHSKTHDKQEKHERDETAVRSSIPPPS